MPPPVITTGPLYTSGLRIPPTLCIEMACRKGRRLAHGPNGRASNIYPGSMGGQSLGSRSFRFSIERALLGAAAAVLLGAATIGVLAQNEPAKTTETAVDPVCGITVQRNPKLSLQYEDQTYYFCMKADLEAFRKNPEKYVRGGSHRHPEPSR